MLLTSISGYQDFMIEKNKNDEGRRGREESTRERTRKKLMHNLAETRILSRKASKNCIVTAAEKIDKMEVEVSAKKPRIVEDNAVEKTKAEEQCNRLQASKASQLVGNCSATTVDHGEKFEEPRSTKAVKRTQVAESESFLREIDQKLLKPLRKTIGSGTFGVCQLAEYRDWTVVVKEFRSRSRREDVKGEVLHEAKVLAKLGDHQGLPFLFGVQTKVKPYSIVLQFLGTKEHSLTVWRAVFKKKLSCDEWIRVLDSIAETLHHIHSKGYLHNDLKANNVVLEVRYGMQVNPVIIDFGKSTKINSLKLKKKTLSKSEQNIYRGPTHCSRNRLW